ncbi:MAG: IS91 family transposase [Acidobacteria bacterium]|jgi:hypothetical protein|nr:IS91 family transposase [Acidobacteriota bacterium]
MFEVADIFRLHGAAYRARFGNRLLPSQTRAMRDIEACRTPYFGGHIKQCDNRECGRKVYVYHSCGNRSCPKCHRQQTERWLERQRARLLPTQHYLLTFTLPKELRTLAFAHQNKIYGLLMRCAAAALQKLADDPRYVGGRLGLMGVVHTWTRAMLYHPHVHFLATAGGFSRDGAEWIKAKNPAFLVPVDALSVIFRAKVCAALKKAGLLEQTPGIVWKKKWVVHCQPAGSGQKVLEYLGRYIFRVAITNNRLERIENGQITFRYRDNRTQEERHVTIPAVEFISRFLQHVLPRGCTKVRYYGIWSGSCRKQLDQARDLLSHILQPDSPFDTALPNTLVPLLTSRSPDRCPYCKIGLLLEIECLYPQRRAPP